MSTGTGGIGSGSTVGNTDTDTNTSGNTNTSSTGVANTSASGSQLTTQNLTNALLFDQSAKAALDASLRSTQYSKDSAIADAQEASAAAMTQILQGNMPGIQTATKNTGGYNATTEKLMSNDLMAKTAAAGSSVVLDAITKYAAANATGINAATGAVTATSGKTTTGTTDVDTTGTTNTINSGTSNTAQAGSSNADTNSASHNIATSASGGTVICTQLYRDGFIPEAVYRADQQFVDAHFTEATINGYRFWAVPFVYAMRKSPSIYAIGKYFGIRWCNHCAAHYIASPTVRKNTVTKIAMWFGVPVCFILGSLLPEVKYYKLWEGS